VRVSMMVFIGINVWEISSRDEWQFK
jgi:hypothetical protein